LRGTRWDIAESLPPSAAACPAPRDRPWRISPN